jgi:hypothetical protein
MILGPVQAAQSANCRAGVLDAGRPVELHW